MDALLRAQHLGMTGGAPAGAASEGRFQEIEKFLTDTEQYLNQLALRVAQVRRPAGQVWGSSCMHCSRGLQFWIAVQQGLVLTLWHVPWSSVTPLLHTMHSGGRILCHVLCHVLSHVPCPSFLQAISIPDSSLQVKVTQEASQMVQQAINDARERGATEEEVAELARQAATESARNSELTRKVHSMAAEDAQSR